MVQPNTSAFSTVCRMLVIVTRFVFTVADNHSAVVSYRAFSFHIPVVISNSLARLHSPDSEFHFIAHGQHYLASWHHGLDAEVHEYRYNPRRNPCA